MLEKISEGRMDKDIVSLHHYRDEEHNDPAGRYVFTVEGPRASGMGSVGAGASFVHVRTDRNGVTVHDEAEIDDVWAVPHLQVWADAHCLGDNYPKGDRVTLAGAEYEYGIAWSKHPGGDFWVVDNYSLGRRNGKITEVGKTRMRRILQVARDLYMKVPDIEKTVVRRALTVEAQRLLKGMEESKTRIAHIGLKLDALDK